MQTDRNALARIQRAVVVQLLADAHPEWWTVSELAQALDSPQIRSALAKLAASDVIQTEGARVRASRCARHLDALGLIAVRAVVPTNHDLGRAIRRLRRSRRLNMIELAVWADMSPSYVSRIERGRSSPTWEMIVCLAQALEVSLPVLMQRIEEEAEVARAMREARARLRGS